MGAGLPGSMHPLYNELACSAVVASYDIITSHISNLMCDMYCRTVGSSQGNFGISHAPIFPFMHANYASLIILS